MFSVNIFSFFKVFLFFYIIFFSFLNTSGLILSNFAVSVIGMHQPLARLDSRKMYVFDY